MRVGLPRDLRTRLLAVAMLGLGIALAGPEVRLSRPGYDLLLVLDITGSMNARDRSVDGRVASRLAFVQATLRTFLARLPCGSRAGLGVFTERRSFLLFEPVEVCANFAPLDGAVAALDWRMAWEGDSRIAAGLDSALELARGVGADLVFLSDGHEAPPLPPSAMLPAPDVPPVGAVGAGTVRGVVAGVGGAVPVPIPRFDAQGRETGFYRPEDVPHETRLGPPPADASSRPGWHPRNAPWGGAALAGTEHLSALREDHLRALAARTGLGYRPLTDAAALEAALRANGAARRPVTVTVDARPVPAGVALLALLTLYGVLPLRDRLWPGRRRPFLPNPTKV